MKLSKTCLNLNVNELMALTVNRKEGRMKSVKDNVKPADITTTALRAQLTITRMKVKKKNDQKKKKN